MYKDILEKALSYNIIVIIALMMLFQADFIYPVSIDQATHEVDRMSNKEREIEKIVSRVPKKPRIEKEEEKTEEQNAEDQLEENANELATEETINIDNIK